MSNGVTVGLIDFDYDGENMVCEVTATAAGASRVYKVTAERDEMPLAPWDSESFAPTLFYCERGGEGVRGYETPDEIHFPPFHEHARMFDSEDGRRAMLDIVGQDESDFRDYVEYEQMEGRPEGDAFADFIGDELYDMRPHGACHSGADYTSALAQAWTLLGYHARDFSLSGCSQGDYADCLVVWTPEWRAKVGTLNHTPEMIARDMDSHIETLNQHWQGDVYDYRIESEDGEILDSCGSLYGEDWLCQMVRESIQYIAARDFKAAT